MSTIRAILAALLILAIVSVAWLLRIDVFEVMERDCNDY
jgi:hypothetical protein